MTAILFPTLTDDVRVHHATKARAAKLYAMLSAEYPALRLEAIVSDDGESRVSGWAIRRLSTDEHILETEKVPDLEDVLEACLETGFDPDDEIPEEEEPRVSGSVVPEQYRVKYREISSNGQCNGDWLAEWLVEQTTDGEGKLDVEHLTQIFLANLPAEAFDAPWARLVDSGQKGWQGRYRMNGRQLVEKTIAKSGECRLADGSTVKVPGEFVEAMQAKHARWLAKEAKRDAAVAEVARGAMVEA